MSRFASGKHAYGISDRSGFRYRLKDMRKEWNGLLVGNDEWEAKHPQLSPFNVVADAESLKNARPEVDLEQQRDMQYGFRPVGFRSIAGLTPPSRLEGVGQVGTVGFPVTVLLTAGTSCTGAVGTVAFPKRVPVTGVSATASTKSTSLALGGTFGGTGSSGTGGVGSVTVVV